MTLRWWLIRVAQLLMQTTQHPHMHIHNNLHTLGYFTTTEGQQGLGTTTQGDAAAAAPTDAAASQQAANQQAGVVAAGANANAAADENAQGANAADNAQGAGGAQQQQTQAQQARQPLSFSRDAVSGEVLDMVKEHAEFLHTCGEL